MTFAKKFTTDASREAAWRDTVLLNICSAGDVWAKDVKNAVILVSPPDGATENSA